jgi:small nuclear ribonucleoprotein (snRNP)-like protein
MGTRLLLACRLVPLIVVPLFFVSKCCSSLIIVSYYHLQIEVLLPENRRQEGTLNHYNLHYNIALVSVEDSHDVCRANTVFYWKGFEVAAVGRCFESGALMAKTGDIVFWSGALDCDFLVHSSCKITKVILCLFPNFSW